MMSFVIPSAARDLARRFPTTAGKIPRSLRSLGMTGMSSFD